MTMKIRYLFFCLIVFSISSLVFAEKVDLVGVVQNKYGTAIEGASLKLFGDEDIMAVTDSDGKFHISGEITSVERKSVFSSKKRIAFRGSRVVLNLEKLSPVNVDIFNIDGKKVHGFNCGQLRAGLNVIPLPVRQLSSGMYMVVVNVNSNRHIFRCVSSSGKIASLEISDVNTAGGSLHKSAASLVVIDSILVTADGYENTSYPIETYQESNIIITLGNGSRLDNITKKCVDCMPEPISGGQSGWGSRYWDCCKPHCSWPENTESMCANC
ncbi:MAG: T9SS type A sorting domain-containing protein, partial [Fibrobacter sp.]|nr:T9SS type A sorting domain-containing protein [Fibrobacter sp.]